MKIRVLLMQIMKWLNDYNADVIEADICLRAVRVKKIIEKKFNINYNIKLQLKI